MTVNINHEQLQSYISSHETAVRTGSVQGVPVGEVFRYGGFVGSDIQSFPCLDRAMDYCRSYLDQLEEENRSVASGSLVLADSLSSSKGRFERVWHAPEGGLWGCMILVNTFVDESINLLSLALGLSCCEAIREAGVDNSFIRWVNDVLLDGRKAAGFLVEGYCTPLRREEYHLVGFGINVNNDTFPEDLGSTAISLKEAMGGNIDHHLFCVSFLAKLSWNLGLIYYEEQQKLMTGDYSGSNGRHLLVEQWEKLSDSIGRQVLYGYDVVRNPQYQATVTTIKNDGGLIMRLDDGSKIVEYSGEIRYL